MTGYIGHMLGAERFMTLWHKSQEKAGKSREVNQAAKLLLANQTTKRGNVEEEGGGGEKRKT